jgi:hypothetical protein
MSWNFVGVLKYWDFALQDLRESIEKFPRQIGRYLDNMKAGDPSQTWETPFSAGGDAPFSERPSGEGAIETFKAVDTPYT